jgi:hypothetical protein
LDSTPPQLTVGMNTPGAISTVFWTVCWAEAQLAAAAKNKVEVRIELPGGGDGHRQ